MARGDDKNASLGFEDKLWLAADVLRNNMDPAEYKHVAGFCKAVKLAEIQSHDFVLTPGRHVGAEEAEDDGEPFEEKMERLVTALGEQQAEGRRLDPIAKALGGLGW